MYTLQPTKRGPGTSVASAAAKKYAKRKPREDEPGWNSKTQGNRRSGTPILPFMTKSSEKKWVRSGDRTLRKN